MAFDGEDNFRQALADAERHESLSAMVRLVSLKGALAEIERMVAENARLREALESIADIQDRHPMNIGFDHRLIRAKELHDRLDEVRGFARYALKPKQGDQ